jgi:hypothetical protein
MFSQTDAQAFYDAAKAAYLKAVKAQSYDHTGSQVSFSKQNQKIESLRNDLEYWSAQLAIIADGGGILEGRLAPSYDQ